MRQSYNLKQYIVPRNWSNGRSFYLNAIWRLFFRPLVASYLPGSSWRINVLNIFGASIHHSVNLKPHIIITCPWNLKINKHSWIGEFVWIDNIDQVVIGSNSCVSQGVYICTGNHNYKSPTFDLITSEVIVGDSVWICAQALIAPGVTIASGAVVGFGSVITKDVSENELISMSNSNYSRKIT